MLRVLTGQRQRIWLNRQLGLAGGGERTGSEQQPSQTKEAKAACP